MRVAKLILALAALLSVDAAALSAQSRRSSQSLLDSLRSPSVAVRADAFDELSRRGMVTSRIGAQLHQLFQRENAYFFGFPTSEGYREYYDEVGEACMRFCDRSDPKVNRTLAGSSYNTDSPLAIELARDHGPDILPLLFELSRDSSGPKWSEHRRFIGVTMLGVVAEQSRQLTPADRQRIRAVALEALKDTGSVVVRRAGVITLAVVGVQADVAVLQRIAETDTYHTTFKGVTTYRTRDEAAKAIKRINARAQPK